MSDSGIKYSSDLGAPPTGTSFQPAGTLGDKDVAFSSDTGATGGKLDEAKAAVRDNAGKLTGQATDKARELADQGKVKARESLGQLSKMLEDAAQQIDEKLGAQYGDYARSAAGQVNGIADRIEAKDVDELMDDVLGFVRQSPGVAIGAAATVGFLIARLVQAGLDERPR
jgi:uncharacterized protein YjbJ (UPF0337 family)